MAALRDRLLMIYLALEPHQEFAISKCGDLSE
jgi:hypothetical protein